MAPTQPGELKRRHDAAVRAAVDAQARGRFGLALDLHAEALEHALQLGERRLVHAARINVSSCYLSLGEWEEARKGLPAIILESDRALHVSAAAAQLAEALMHEGRLEKASHYLDRALAEARRAGDPRREASSLVMKGHLAVMSGAHDRAVTEYSQALETHDAIATPAPGDLEEKVGRQLEEATRAALLDYLGYSLLLAERLGEGLVRLRQGRNILRRVENPRLEAEIEKDLAFGFLLGRKDRAAERHALNAMALAQRHGYGGVLRNSYYVLMEVSLRLSRTSDFDAYFDRLQDMLPDVKLSRDFFRIFDLSDVVNLKEF